MRLSTGFEFSDTLGSTTAHYGGLLCGVLDYPICTFLTQGKYTATTARILNSLALVWNIPITFYRFKGQFMVSADSRTHAFKNRVTFNRQTMTFVTID